MKCHIVEWKKRKKEKEAFDQIQINDRNYQNYPDSEDLCPFEKKRIIAFFGSHVSNAMRMNRENKEKKSDADVMSPVDQDDLGRNC
jgi:hypothetical protein